MYTVPVRTLQRGQDITLHSSPLHCMNYPTQDTCVMYTYCPILIFFGTLRRKPGTTKPCTGPTLAEWVGTRETRCASGPSWLLRLPCAASMSFMAWQEFLASQKSMSSHWILQNMLTNILNRTKQIEQKWARVYLSCFGTPNGAFLQQSGLMTNKDGPCLKCFAPHIQSDSLVRKESVHL